MFLNKFNIAALSIEIKIVSEFEWGNLQSLSFCKFTLN
jgi:hypothetical protein